MSAFNFKNDISEILTPQAPLHERWSAKKRRRARRGGLRSVLGAWEPSCLTELMGAIEARYAFTLKNAGLAKESRQRTAGELDEAVRECRESYLQLVAAKSTIGRLIKTHFVMRDVAR